MNKKLELTANKIFGSRGWHYAEYVIYSVLFFLLILFLADYDNALYQPPKYMKEALFLSAMTGIVFLIRKVRLLNWQSLAATLIFIPLTFYQVHIYREMPDIMKVALYRVPFYWLTVMIIIDMFLYGKLNRPKKENSLMILLYVCMTVWMLFNRNTRNEPLYLVFPFGLFMLTKITKKDWEKLFECFLSGWFLVYLYAVIKSIIKNPYTGGRYYGYFVNIGSFGTFLCGAFIAALVSILYCKSKWGRKNLLYVISIVWMLSDLFLFYLTSTRTLMMGVIFALLTLFFVNRKDISKKTTLKRVVLVLGIVAALVAIYVVIIINARQLMDLSRAVVKKSQNSGLLSPIYMFAVRIRTLYKHLDRTNTWTMIYSSVDTLSSYRLRIIKEFSQYFNFGGNGPMYAIIESIDYVAVTAHNTYAQYILDYGYGVAALIFSVVIGGFITAIKNFLKRGRQVIDMLPVLWIPMTLGVWLGESCWMFFPVTFIMMFLICRMISESEDEVRE